MNGLTVMLQKGGVGKTTIATNLADRLAARGHEVVLVDVDPQGSATEALGCGDAYTADTHLAHVLDPDDPSSASDLLRTDTEPWGVDLVPSNAALHQVSATIQTADDGEAKLYRSLVRPLSDRYDWIVFDAPPTIGPLADAALVATRRAVLPMQLSKPSADALVRTVTNQLFPLSDRLPDSDPIEILAIVPNRVKGDNEERRVLEALEDSQFDRFLPGFARSSHLERDDSPGPGIRERIAFRRAYRDGVSLAAHDETVDMIDRFDALAALADETVKPDENE
ncbi:ParA family protein [Halopiger xanaduensis]|uniref:Cobyrinic acid ac-diamide synthase n=1 Tax=Halopiger xanaduensis (strain DSM 18323 / JCM 14033 / SH-6) TaxID=797210 RepID=F8D7Q4_HALXS|nr:ParA family protein [Halopiger xanaduensis]AEH35502.1 Cobyrinic acid ac-diamide synthase [Halopiger xanaduensis SH-6]